MKRVRNLAVAGCTVLLLCQCASKDEIRDLNYQIRAVNQKVEDVRSSTVDQMQKRQASSVSRIDEVQNEVVQLPSASRKTPIRKYFFASRPRRVRRAYRR